jgi:phosphoribosylamine--glycine ligase
MAAGGYPDSYQKGQVISGLPPLPADDAMVFHAGTRMENNQVLTNGGRVLCATALGDSVEEAQQKAYELVKRIHWDNVYYRNDIGYRAIARERSLT